MKKDKIKLYLFEILLLSFLIFTLFASNIITDFKLMIITIVFAAVCLFLLKGKRKKSVFDFQANILISILAFIFVGLYYLLGFYYGFEKTKYLLNFSNIVNIVLPIFAIIISDEIIRRTLIAQDGKITIKSKKFDISTVLIYIINILLDLALYLRWYDLSYIDDFLMALGFLLFSSLSSNLFYNYYSRRFGSKGIIIFRLVTTLYAYLLPVVPGVYIFLRSFLKMLFPLLLYLIYENIYGKKMVSVAKRSRRVSIVSTTIVITIITLIIMLISCEFKYGIIVIGSTSMTGTINKGDAVIFERYDGGDIKKGQIIIFDSGGYKTVHRVVEIRKANNQIRYITKGDNNINEDLEFKTKKDILGVVKLRIKYLGKPSLWFRSLFK